MNLNNTGKFKKLDKGNMLAEINGLPDQLLEAWALGQALELPPWEGIKRVLIAGMGGSAIGADLLVGYISPFCPVPVTVVHNYDLPAWAAGQETLVICSSYSGNTDETLSAFRDALAKGCRVLVVTTGGQLAIDALEAGVGMWVFKHQSQPRSAVGYVFGLLLAVFSRLGLIRNPEDELAGAIAAMRVQQVSLRADVPVKKNPAKRLVGRCLGRGITVFGADFLAPVARRWKAQISEMAKAWTQFEELPEANHNTIAGLFNPKSVLKSTFALFLRGNGLHQRNLLQTNLTKELLIQEGIGADFYDAPGKNRLEQLWTALHFGDYLAYYLAMAYEVDPMYAEAIETLKSGLKER